MTPTDPTSSGSEPLTDAAPASPAPRSTHTLMPPAHIRSAFSTRATKPLPLGEEWGPQSWRCGDVVLSPVGDVPRARSLGEMMEKVRPTGTGISRPVRSTDGRLIAGGWRARTFVPGRREPRFDEIAAAVLSLNESMRGMPEPSFLTPPQAGGPWSEFDVFLAADAAAWSDRPTAFIAPALDPTSIPRADIAHAIARAAALTSLRTAIISPSQPVHADPLGCAIVDGWSSPVFSDLVIAHHPAAWSVALLVVDAMAWAGGPDALLTRWEHLPEFDQLLLRAVLYRVVLHILHPSSTPEAWRGLSRVVNIVEARCTPELEAMAFGSSDDLDSADDADDEDHAGVDNEPTDDAVDEDTTDTLDADPLDVGALDAAALDADAHDAVADAGANGANAAAGEDVEAGAEGDGDFQATHLAGESLAAEGERDHGGDSGQVRASEAEESPEASAPQASASQASAPKGSAGTSDAGSGRKKNSPLNNEKE